MKRIFILILFLSCLFAYAQQSRQWTNKEGKSFTGTVVECDGVTAKYKIFGRKNLFEFPLADLGLWTISFGINLFGTVGDDATPEEEVHTMITNTIVQDMANNGITVNSVVEK